MKSLRAAAIAAILLLTGGCSRNTEIVGTFPAAGIERIVLRAASAKDAVTESAPQGSVSITISGKAAGGTVGYHSADPFWKETPASDWGMAFVGKQFGSVLVISSVNEIGYMHDHYAIEDIQLRLPPGTQLIRESRQLSDSGEPDLSEPHPPKKNQRTIDRH